MGGVQQKEAVNAKDGVDHYMEMAWVILSQIVVIDTFPHGWISWACVLACEVSEYIFTFSVSCLWLGGF